MQRPPATAQLVSTVEFVAAIVLGAYALVLRRHEKIPGALPALRVVLLGTVPQRVERVVHTKLVADTRGCAMNDNGRRPAQ